MATTQNFNYPSSSDVTITGIGNPTGQPVPPDAIFIAGENPEGNLTPVAVTDGGAVVTTPASGSVQHVIVDSSALPTGASTSAAQATAQTTLNTISTTDASILLDMTNGSQITQITGTVPLPTGAATAANQTTQETTLSAIQANQTNGTQVVSVSNFPATQPVSGTVTVVQPTGTNLHVVVDNVASGTATAALQSSTQGAAGTPGTAAIASTLVGGIFNNSPPVITSGQQGAIQLDSNGRVIIAPLNVSSVIKTVSSGRQQSSAPFFQSYASTPVTTTTYSTILASVGSSGISFIDIFDSSGQAMILATGAIGSEVPLAYIPPGGDQISVLVTAGTRLSIKALTANATAGYILANFWFN